MNGQDNYDFSTSNSPYADLVGGISLNNGQIWDDEEFIIPLGFDLKISTYTFNTLYIIEWGEGGSLSQTRSETGKGSLFVPMGLDIIDLGYDNEVSLSNISYKIEGVPGDRIVKIEWNHVGFWEDWTNSDYCNFQLWLYESSNSVEYHYGPSQINNPNGTFGGQTGPNVGFVPSGDFNSTLLDENAYILTGNPVNPTVIKIKPGEEGQNPGGALLGMIPEGTVYTFSPKKLSTESFKKEDFIIYPNPANDFLNIQTNAGEYQVTIYNSLGQEVKHKKNTEGAIDVLNLPNGVYFVQIESIYGKTTKKFIKN